MNAWRIATPVLVSSAALVLALPACAQWLNYPTKGIPRTADGKANLAAPTPRTSDGHPDLTGLWNKVSPKYARNIAADLKPGDMKPWVEDLIQQRAEDLQKEYMNAQCLPLGPGYPTAADSTGAEQVKIVQAPNLILLLNPDLTYRQVFMDGRPLEKDPNPDWMGYSVGHWDGDTLVVETNGFNDKTWLDHDGHPHTEALRMTERYTRRNIGNLDVEVTLSDPAIYTKPWTVAVRATLAPDTEMLEWVCEHNPREHWVGKASDEFKNEPPIAPDVLTSYVGTYVEQPRLWRTNPRTLELSVSGGHLYGDMDGRGKVRLVAISETEFSGLYGLNVEITKPASGEAQQLFVKHVSGNYRFARKN